MSGAARRCKVGDLAIIIKQAYPQQQANVGKIVEVVADASPQADWVCETRGSPFKWGDELFDTKEMLDEQLRPLRGSDEPVAKTRRIKNPIKKERAKELVTVKTRVQETSHG